MLSVSLYHRRRSRTICFIRPTKYSARGRRLADPVSAVPELTDKTTLTPLTLSLGYSGGESLPQIARITTNIRQEWRTPPLWGVAVSAPYLHDGRAKTLEDAVLLHGGEGEHSAGQYRRLKRSERTQVIAFLNSLTAGDGREAGRPLGPRDAFFSQNPGSPPFD